MVVDQKVRVVLVVDDEPDVEPLFRQRMRRRDSRWSVRVPVRQFPGWTRLRSCRTGPTSSW